MSYNCTYVSFGDSRRHKRLQRNAFTDIELLRQYLHYNQPMATSEKKNDHLKLTLSLALKFFVAFLCLLVVRAIIFSLPSSAKVSMKNLSSMTIRDATIEVRGRSFKIHNLPSGAISKSFGIPIGGDADYNVSVEFANGKQLSQKCGYLDSMLQNDDLVAVLDSSIAAGRHDKNEALSFGLLVRTEKEIRDSPELVEPQKLLRALDKLGYTGSHDPMVAFETRGGYSWDLDSSLIAKPVSPDSWELSTKKQQLSVIGSHDTKMFVFIHEKQLRELPKEILPDLAVVLFAKKSVIIIEPFKMYYIDLPWSWRDPFQKKTAGK